MSSLEGYFEYLIHSVGSEHAAELIGVPEWLLRTWLPPRDRRARWMTKRDAQRVMLAVAEAKKINLRRLQRGKSYTSPQVAE